MKNVAIPGAALALCTGLAMAGPVAPTDVVWVDDLAVPASLSGTPGDLENGKVLMNKGAGNCIACHQVTALDDLPFHGEIGPTLDGVADRYTAQELRGILTDSKRWFEGTMMPSFYKVDGFIRPGEEYTGKAKVGEVTPLLTAQEIEDVLAFLQTLKEE